MTIHPQITIAATWGHLNYQLLLDSDSDKHEQIPKRQKIQEENATLKNSQVYLMLVLLNTEDLQIPAWFENHLGVSSEEAFDTGFLIPVSPVEPSA